MLSLPIKVGQWCEKMCTTFTICQITTKKGLLARKETIAFNAILTG